METISAARLVPQAPTQWSLSLRNGGHTVTSNSGTPSLSSAISHARTPFSLCKRSRSLTLFRPQQRSIRQGLRLPADGVRCQVTEHAQKSSVFTHSARPALSGGVQSGGHGTIAIKGSRGAQKVDAREVDAVNEERLDALSATLRGALAAAVLNGGDNLHMVAASIVALVLASVPPQQLGSFIMHLGDSAVLPSQQQIEKLLRRIDHALRLSASGRSNLVQMQEAVRLLQQSSRPPASSVSHFLHAAGNTASAIGNSAASSISRSLSGASAMGSSAAEGVARGFADVARKVAETLIESDEGLKASFAMDIDMTSSAVNAKALAMNAGVALAPQAGADVFAMLQSAVTAQRTAKKAQRFKVMSEEETCGARKEPVVYVPLELAANVTDSKPVQVQVYGQTLVLWRPRPGEVAAISDVCPHRGASLAMGSLVGTTAEGGRGKCVKCPYHGLEFDAAGTCQKKNIHSEPIKLVEANGVIWMEEKAPVTGVIDVEAMEMPPLLRSVMESLSPEPRDAPASAIPAVPRSMIRPKRSNAPAAARDSSPVTPLQQAELPEDVLRSRAEALSDARPRSDVEVLDGPVLAAAPIDGGEENAVDVPLVTEDTEAEVPNAGLPFNEHFLEPGYSELGGTVDIAAAPRAVVDNTFDLHHMMYVHASSFGGGELIRTWKPDALTICFEYGMNRKKNPFHKFFGDGRVLVTMQRSPPYSAMVTVGDPSGAVVLKTLTHVVPVTSTKSKLVWQLLRNFGRPSFMDLFFRQAVKQILAEDKAVLEGVNLQGVRKGMEIGI